LWLAESAWVRVASPTTVNLHDVASKLDDVVIVGEKGTILRLGDPREGFRIVASGTLHAVIGSIPTMYAVGDHGTILSHAY